MLLNMIQHRVNPVKSYDENPNTYQGKPFQVLGFDILVDQKMKCWILEINDHPSFNILICRSPKGSGCDHKNCALS